MIGEPDQSRALGRKLTANNITMMSARAPAAVVLIRLAVGGVFLFEGIQKFLFPMEMGPGLFAKLGIPAPGLLAPLAGLIEVVCGSMLIVGFLTRLATIPLIITMLTAIFSLGGHIYKASGFWAMAHETRTDYAMLLACLFLLAVGAGPVSIDRMLRTDFVEKPIESSPTPPQT
jgi:putative oxidoreductase